MIIERISFCNLLKVTGICFDVYTKKEAENSADAVTMTMRRFGPSESSKKWNMVREKISDVTARMASEVFLER
jgi:hypothetical protein